MVQRQRGFLNLILPLNNASCDSASCYLPLPHLKWLAKHLLVYLQKPIKLQTKQVVKQVLTLHSRLSLTWSQMMRPSVFLP